MKCFNCGQEINDDAFLCNYCGSTVKTNSPVAQSSDLLAPPVTPVTTNQQVNVVPNVTTVDNNNVPVQSEQVVAEPINSVSNTDVQPAPQVTTHQVNHMVKGTSSPIALELENEEIKTTKTGLLSIFGIINIIIFIVFLVAGYYLAEKLPAKNILLCLVGSSIVYFYVYCYEKILIKADIPWWFLFIPILNIYALLKVSFGASGAKSIFSFFVIAAVAVVVLATRSNPVSLSLAIKIESIVFNIVSPIIGLIQSFLLGRNFGRSGLLTILLPFIIIPAIALGSNEYQG